MCEGRGEKEKSFEMPSFKRKCKQFGRSSGERISWCGYRPVQLPAAIASAGTHKHNSNRTHQQLDMTCQPEHQHSYMHMYMYMNNMYMYMHIVHICIHVAHAHTAIEGIKNL